MPFRDIIRQQFPIVYLHKSGKHGLRGKGRSHGGRRRIYANGTLIGFGIQLLLQSGIYHITAFRPPGCHFCLYRFLAAAQIEAEHSRVLSSRPVHKAVRQGIAQRVLPALLHTDGYVRLNITTDYSGVGKLQYIAAQGGIDTLDIQYTDKAVFTFLVPIAEEGRFTAQITEGTAGKAVIQRGDEVYYGLGDSGLVVF